MTRSTELAAEMLALHEKATAAPIISSEGADLVRYLRNHCVEIAEMLRGQEERLDRAYRAMSAMINGNPEGPGQYALDEMMAHFKSGQALAFRAAAKGEG
jgi:Mg2+ and Co2+ transporter CorA